MSDSAREVLSGLDSSSNDAQKRPREKTPLLISPPDTRTPPTESHKRIRHAQDREAMNKDPSSEPIDPTALSRALHKFERSREHTPGSSPSRKRARVQGGDR